MPRLRRPGLRRRAAAALLFAALLPAGPAAGRPAQLEDLLTREAIGAVAADPTGRWLVIEHEGPYQDGARFDLDVFNDFARTRLERVDLRRPGPARPLFRPDPGTGYVAGPFAPDGKRLAVFRLSAHNWELGVATLATGAVRWLGITPEYTPDSHTLDWLSPTTLVVIARRPGDLPYVLRQRHTAPQRLPARWRASARGQAAVTVVGAGQDLAVRAPAPPRQLLQVDAASGGRRVVASGAFVALSVAGDHRRVALVEALGDTPIRAAHPVQAAYGVEALIHGLRLADLRTGRLTRPAPDQDILLHPLAWSPAADALLVYARRPGDPWPAGGLLTVDPLSGAARALGRGQVTASLDMRPEAARAGWSGRDVIVWGTEDVAPAGSAPAWRRLGPAGAAAVTGGLPGSRRDGLVSGPDGLLVAADGGIWRVSPDGARTLAAENARPATYPQVGRGWRYAYDVPTGEGLVAVRPTPKGDEVLAVSSRGVVPLGLLPPDAELLPAVGVRSGVLARTQPAGGEERLLWLRPGRAPVAIETLNRRVADLDAPDIHAIPHRGPDGQALTSWLLLPRLAPGAPPPPLVVWPYPGAAPAKPPASMDFRRPGFDKFPALLAAHGYAVLLPSLPAPRAGGDPAAGLAARILGVVEAAAIDPQARGRFDPWRLGIWGLSYGGYATLAVLTQTDRFAAAIAESGPSDLISMWGQFQPAMAADPSEGLSSFYSAGWVEDLQGQMQAPPWADPQRYLRNSPLLQAAAIGTPLLLVHGDQDSIPLAQAQEMFSALWRQDKTVQLVTYWGEGHAVTSPGNLRDLVSRAFSWFDRHLQPPPSGDGAAPRPRPESGSASGGPTPRSPRR